MDNEPKQEKSVWKSYGFGCGGCLGLFALTLFIWTIILGYPITPDGYSPAAKRGLCIYNLEQIGIAINMYAQDWDNRLPPASGFGQELDRHSVLWGSRGDIFNQFGKKHIYLPDLLKPYIKFDKVLECQEINSFEWFVPDGDVDLSKNGTTYIYNAWCRIDTTKTPPDGCIKIAGQNIQILINTKNAPLVWDATSGYATKDERYAHFCHKGSLSVFEKPFDQINVLYADFHIKTLTFDTKKSPFNATTGGQGHFWGAPDPKNPHRTLGAQGW